MSLSTRFSAVMFLGVAASSSYSQPSQFDAVIDLARDAFQVPGIAVAIVKDGKVLLAKGYGITKLGTKNPVTADTLFGIASNSKLMTATALAMLVDEGKIDWEDKVQKFMPEFALSNPYVSSELTVRDLLVHRSGLGLGAGDLLWWPTSTYSADEILARARYIPLANSFRNTYEYDNLLYLAAGKLIERVSGTPWNAFVQQRVLNAAGMTGARSDYPAAKLTDRLSSTHAVVDGKLEEVPPFESTAVNGAAGVCAGATDMAKWLQLQLGRGVLPSGVRLYSSAQAEALWTPTTIIPPPTRRVSDEWNATRGYFRGYALGTVLDPYRGRKTLAHNGSLPGYTSWVMMLPDDQIGVAVLTNQESTAAFYSIAFTVVDKLLGEKSVDWISEFQKIVQARTETRRAKSPELTRREGTHPSLPLKDYAATYRDDWYGDITITIEGDGLVMRFSRTPSLVGDMVHWQNDTFLVKWRDRSLRGDAFVTFMLTPSGSVDFAKMAPYDDSVDFSFDYTDLLLRPARKR